MHQYMYIFRKIKIRVGTSLFPRYLILLEHLTIGSFLKRLPLQTFRAPFFLGFPPDCPVQVSPTPPDFLIRGFPGLLLFLCYYSVGHIIKYTAFCGGKIKQIAINYKPLFRRSETVFRKKDRIYKFLTRKSSEIQLVSGIFGQNWLSEEGREELFLFFNSHGFGNLSRRWEE